MAQHSFDALHHPLPYFALRRVRWAIENPFNASARQLTLSLGLPVSSHEVLAVITPQSMYWSSTADEVPDRYNAGIRPQVMRQLQMNRPCRQACEQGDPTLLSVTGYSHPQWPKVVQSGVLEWPSPHNTYILIN